MSSVLNLVASRAGTGHFHGEIDPTVKIEWARASASQLRDAGVLEYVLKEYAHLGHSADQEELEDVEEWLQARLPAT